MANTDNIFLNIRRKEIKNYYYFHFLSGDWKLQLSQYFWLSMTEAVQSLPSLWRPFPHAGISICASVFWNQLRNLSIWKLIQGGKRRVFVSATSTSWFWFAHSPAGQDWMARTEGAQGNDFGWNCMKSQKKHVATSRRQCRSLECTDAFSVVNVINPRRKQRFASCVWATHIFSHVTQK